MAGNLGFDTFVVSDATATFGRRDFNGQWRTSEEVHGERVAEWLSMKPLLGWQAFSSEEAFQGFGS